MAVGYTKNQLDFLYQMSENWLQKDTNFQSETDIQFVTRATTLMAIFLFYLT